ncbi:Telomeric repeat-binding factor 2 [compost metagenome]
MKLKLGTLLVSAMILLSACGETATIEKVEPASTNTEANAATNNEAKNNAEPATTVEEQAPATPDVFKIGDSVTFNDLIITVNSIKDDQGDDFLKPAEGKVYKIVDVSVENKGTTFK